MDTISKARRSWNMSRIKSNDTAPEMIVRSFLHQHGFRYRLHAKELPGKPDIVLPKYRTVIFVHGCFWHRHSGCSRATIPSTHIEYWQKKFADNIDRDQRVEQSLKDLGWNLIVIWECEVKNHFEMVAVCKKLQANFSKIDFMFTHNKSSAQGGITTKYCLKHGIVAEEQK